MVLPLIPVVIGLGAAAGMWGAGKTVKAVMDSSEADDIAYEAGRIVRRANREVEESQVAANQGLESLGRKKYDAVTHTLKRFVDAYSSLQNVELSVNEDMSRLHIQDFDADALQEIRNDISMLESSALGMGSGAAAGAMVAFGAYNGTMLLASAGTGTAISTLSGVAATNATLAWLGGGTLAAGGMGVAGGMMVLGALAAGPALLIFGSVMGSNASEKLNDAKSNREMARAYEDECGVVVAKLKGIAQVASLAGDILSHCRTASRRASSAMAEVIARSGTDYRTFSEADKDLVFKAVKLAQLVKAVVDTPILDADGNLLADCEARLRGIGQGADASS